MQLLLSYRCRLVVSVAAAFATLAWPGSSVSAQVSIDAHSREVVAAGFDLERYLRALQVAGLAPVRPWSIRPFGPGEIVDLVTPESTAHPWSSRTRMDRSRLQAWLVAPEVNATYNTTTPYGYNNGGVWMGRGLTTAARFGFGARVGPLSLIVAPQAFRSENRPFPLQSNGLEGSRAFADPYYPAMIDHPQRFGSGPYQRLDLGQSVLRLDLGPVAAGASTANEYWGPATVQPILLGNNAPGFPHVFAGTSRPLGLWLFSIHGRALWGRLDQSPYSPQTSGETRRFAAGVIAAITVRGLSGLELGAARFYHETWPAGGPRGSDFALPFTLHNFAAARDNLAGVLSDNQLGSVFARWVFPEARIEVFGEFGRDDYNADVPDLVGEPDHESAYVIGANRAWRVGKERLVVLSAEILNSGLTHLKQVRAESPLYVHTALVQGHTNLGQLLGAPAGLGGGGTDVRLDVYDHDGRWSIGVARHLVDSTHPERADVVNALSIERVRFGRRLDLHFGLTPSVELNRRPGQDVGNISARIGAVAHW